MTQEEIIHRIRREIDKIYEKYEGHPLIEEADIMRALRLSSVIITKKKVYFNNMENLLKIIGYSFILISGVCTFMLGISQKDIVDIFLGIITILCYHWLLLPDKDD